MGGKTGSTVQSTSNGAPWSEQQPYIKDIFSNAKSLYDSSGPSYYPGSTFQLPSDAQHEALAQMENVARDSASQISDPATWFTSNLLKGTYAGLDPAMQSLTKFANTTPKFDGTSTLSGLSNTDYANNNPASLRLAELANTNYNNNPGNSVLNSLSGIDWAHNGGVNALNGLASQDFANYNPANGTLGAYARGDYAKAGNPYTQALTDQISAAVTPGVQSQFIQGGMLSNPDAARATAAGVTSALAPTLFANYQQQQQIQLDATKTMGSNYLSGASLMGSLADRLSQDTLSGAQLQGSFGDKLSQNYLAGGALQGNLANQSGQNFFTGAGLQGGFAQMLANLGLSGSTLQEKSAGDLQNAYGQNMQHILSGLALAPTTQQMKYTDPSQLYAAGTTEQSLGQSGINDAVQRWNYEQSAPYQKIAQYLGAVTGNYGGTTTLTQPNQNGGAAGILGGLGSAASGLGALFSLFPSDRRLKEDIEQIDVLDNGLPFYLYRYKGGAVFYAGVMADEVELVHPEAVYANDDGFLMVDYERAVA